MQKIQESSKAGSSIQSQEILESSQEDYQRIHWNVPQLMFHLLKSKYNFLIWGRGTGKSEGPVADFSISNMFAMIGSNGGFIGETYEQILTRTLPAWVEGVRKMGYKQNVHYYIKRSAPEKLRWELPYKHPQKFDHYITFHVSRKQTSGIYLISQDRPGLSNGLSLDWICGDEAKLLNFEKIKKETIPAVRGNADKFGGLWNHGSMLFCTDMPTTPEGQWIQQFKQYMDKDIMKLLLSITAEYIKLSHFALEEKNPEERGKIVAEMKLLEKEINGIKKDETYFSLATTFDNIHALGLDAIKSMRRVLTDFEFLTSVLSEEAQAPEELFYFGIDPEKHGYYGSDYDRLDDLSTDFDYSKGDSLTPDCTWDKDLEEDLPLELACDFGASFNCAVLGQDHGDELRLVNCFHVEAPLRIRDVAEKINNYYKPRQNRNINFYYDHTALGSDAIRAEDENYANEWIACLQKGGWHVNPCPIGQAWAHKKRWLLWDKTLQGKEGAKKFRYNRTRFAQAIVSMQNAKTKETSKGTEKDKSSERRQNYPQADATHYSDAVDTLWCAKHELNSGRLSMTGIYGG